MNKNIILFIGNIKFSIINSIREYEKEYNTSFRIALISNKKKNTKKKDIDIFIQCDFSNKASIEEKIKEIKDDIFIITAYSDENIENFIDIMEHVPYIQKPTAESLLWTVDKTLMRKQFEKFDNSITPQSMYIKQYSENTVEKIIEKINFPAIVKPAGLATSLLVTVNYNEKQLKNNLKNTFQNIEKISKANNRTLKTKVIIEEFLEGEMYSFDGYVSSEGKIKFCPLVYIQTGKNIGFEDFFGYLRITPTQLNVTAIKEAEKVTCKGVEALELRSTTFHAELIQTKQGWKMIEIAARIGGYRTGMYKKSYGINHRLNDLFTRFDFEKISVKKDVLGHSAVMNFFAKKEGKIVAVKGIRKIKKFNSVSTVNQRLSVGDKALYAKNGGKKVCTVYLFNESRELLLNDIRSIEQTIDIQTK